MPPQNIPGADQPLGVARLLTTTNGGQSRTYLGFCRKSYRFTPKNPNVAALAQPEKHLAGFGNQQNAFGFAIGEIFEANGFGITIAKVDLAT